MLIKICDKWIDNINTNDTNKIQEIKNQLKTFVSKSTPENRKIFFQKMNDKEFKKFYSFIINNNMTQYFMGRNTKATFLLNTGGKYINYLYSIMMTNSYDVDFNPFFKFYGLNKEEQDKIMKLFYIDIDYKEKEKPAEYIKNIILGNYDIDDVMEYFYMKYNDMNNCRLYKVLCHAFSYLKKYPDSFNPDDKLLDEKISLSISCKFNEDRVKKILQLTKTSLEPVTGLDVKRYKGSTTTSPTRTTALPLTKTSLEPDIDFLGGYGGCPEQTSPTRTTGLDMVTSF